MTGEQLKLIGMERALEGQRRRQPDWEDLVEEAVWTLAQSGIRFTSDDVAAFVGMERTRALGAVMVRLARQGVIRKVGIRQTANSRAHCAYITEWIGTTHSKEKER